MWCTGETWEGLDELTPRELEVLGLMAQGLSNAAISERLVLGGRTVETHVRHVLLKVAGLEDGLRDRRITAVVAYLRHHEAPAPDRALAAA